MKRRKHIRPLVRLSLEMAALWLIAGIGLVLLSCGGCSHRLLRRGKVSISAPHSLPELWGAYNEAAEKLGRTHAGGTIRVRYIPGDVMSAIPPWKGVVLPGRGVALGLYNQVSDRITLYTTGGRWRHETARWEFGRSILESRGVRDEWEQVRIMEQSGFR